MDVAPFKQAYLATDECKTRHAKGRCEAMTKEQAKLVGTNLAKHKGEWVVLANGRIVSHAPRLKDAVAAVPKRTKNPAIYYSSSEDAEMICATL